MLMYELFEFAGFKMAWITDEKPLCSSIQFKVSILYNNNIKYQHKVKSYSFQKQGSLTRSFRSERRSVAI